jgi:HEAT repeat protein
MKRIVRLLIGVVVGMAVLIGLVLILSRLLGDHETIYQGKSFNDWCAQLTNRDAAAASQAKTTLTSLIIPQLTNQMFSDTNDSSLRMSLIEQLNNMPGMQIFYTPASGRRAIAVNDLGSLGLLAKDAATPALLEVLKRKDEVLTGAASDALVKIQADPDAAIPVLLDCMVDRDGHGQSDVVEALGEYGPKAKAAVPTLIKLLSDRSSKEIMEAVPKALKKIDPEAAAKAGVK